MRMRNPPPGARGAAYIALPNERGLSDQTDLNRKVYHNTFGRWIRIREAGTDWPPRHGRCPRGEGGCPAPGPLGLPFVPIASGVFLMIENCHTR